MSSAHDAIVADACSINEQIAEILGAKLWHKSDKFDRVVYGYSSVLVDYGGDIKPDEYAEISWSEYRAIERPIRIFGLRNHSTDLGEAIKAIEEFCETEPLWKFIIGKSYRHQGQWFASIERRYKLIMNSWCGQGKSLPLAICQAIIKAYQAAREE